MSMCKKILDAVEEMEAKLTPEQKKERARKMRLRIKATQAKQEEEHRKQIQGIAANKDKFYGGVP